MKIDKPQSHAIGIDPGFRSPVEFRLDGKSGVPTYLQLVHQVEHALRLGYLQLGDQLPRVKDIVGSLSINPNTVIKAYADLEGKGIAVGRPGQGTFIISVPETIAMSQLDTLRRSLKRGWLRSAKEAGLDENGMVALFMRTLGEFTTEQVTSPGPDVDQSEVVA